MKAERRERREGWCCGREKNNCKQI